MRQFYLYRNSSGYYNAVFVDPISEKKGTDKIQATIIAQKWIESGAPQTRSNARNFSATSTDNPLNLKDICERLSQEEAETLINLLCQKFRLSTPQQITISQTNKTPAPVEIKKPAETATAKPQTSGIPLSEYMLNFWDYDQNLIIIVSTSTFWIILTNNCS